MRFGARRLESCEYRRERVKGSGGLRVGIAETQAQDEIHICGANVRGDTGRDGVHEVTGRKPADKSYAIGPGSDVS